MSNAKHTPGPWEVSHNGQWIRTVKKDPKLGPSYVASVVLEIEPNARLLAAAPELLAMLKETVRLTEYYYNCVSDRNKATEAIISTGKELIIRIEGVKPLDEREKYFL